jgi:hypothetical protein
MLAGVISGGGFIHPPSSRAVDGETRIGVTVVAIRICPDFTLAPFLEIVGQSDGRRMTWNLPREPAHPIAIGAWV